MLIVLLIIFLIVFYYINMNVVTTNKYIIKSKKISNDNKIVFLSDLHNKEFGKLNERLIKKINNLNPDIIVLGGDMIEKINRKYENTFKFISILSEKYEIVAICGNHEIENKDKTVIENYKNLRIKFLVNDSFKVDDINFFGLDYYNRKDNLYYDVLDKYKLEDNCYNILLAHNPLLFDIYDKFKFDLVLSGHVHGGIIRLFGIGLLSPERKLFPKYSKGLYKGNNSNIIVSSGLGDSIVRFRLFNLPEIVYIELRRK